MAVIKRKHSELYLYLPLDSHDESNLWLSLDEERTVLFGLSLTSDQIGVLLDSFVVILLSVFSSDLSSSGSISLCLSSRILECLENLSVSFLLLKNVFWDNPSSKLKKD